MTRLIEGIGRVFFILRSRKDDKMAGSNITKRALAGSLKLLMSENNFNKISIADICEQCEMNRKSFYYHFRDKYELINWIFDFEFCAVSKDKEYASVWDAFYDLCDYFYMNKEFYREAFKIEGQNSFKEYLGNYCYPLFLDRYKLKLADLRLAELQSKLLSETLINSIKLWLTEKDCITPERFVGLLQDSIQQIAVKICNE